MCLALCDSHNAENAVRPQKKLKKNAEKSEGEEATREVRRRSSPKVQRWRVKTRSLWASSLSAQALCRVGECPSRSSRRRGPRRTRRGGAKICIHSELSINRYILNL